MDFGGSILATSSRSMGARENQGNGCSLQIGVVGISINEAWR